MPTMKIETEQVTSKENTSNVNEPDKEVKSDSSENVTPETSQANDNEEREKALTKREKDLEVAERKFKARSLISDKGLPVELVDFLDFTNDDTMISSIDKLAQIIEKCSSKTTRGSVIFSTGLNHQSMKMSSDDDFMKGFAK